MQILIRTVLLCFAAALLTENSCCAQKNTFAESSTSLLSSWTPPLSTRGRFIVDATGKRFRLKSGNFHGASGTYNGWGDYDDPANHHAGEAAYQTVLCLDRKPLADIIEDFLRLGINSVRLPFSNAMISSTKIVPDHALLANPDLHNLTPLEIYDRVVQALTRRGLAVVLNNHTVKDQWCCGLDSNGRWNTAQSTERWIQDWLFMASRYRNNTRVVGADLYNEVRRDLLVDPTWGGGQEQDWYTASMQVATRIQREANRDILIFIEGINWVGVPLPFVPHYRPELDPVKELSHALPYNDKLVYCAHFYPNTGPNATGLKTNLGILHDRTYGQLTPKELREVVQRLAGYVATAVGAVQQHFTTPVWISEFGVGGRNEYSQVSRQWWGNFTQLLAEFELDFAVWPLVGWQERGQGDLWALNAYDSTGESLTMLDAGDWRLERWRMLINASVAEQVPIASELSTWRMLAPEWNSQQQSNWLHTRNLDQPGDRKASCPDGLRLVGLSHSDDPRGLCTDAVLGRNLWNYMDESAAVVVITSESEVQSNWAQGYIKLQCPFSAHLIGYSYEANLRLASAVCAASARLNSSVALTQYRSVWFDKSDSPDADRHGRFAPVGVPLGTCADDEVATGFAFTKKQRSGRRPAALLCAAYGVVMGSSNSNEGAHA